MGRGEGRPITPYDQAVVEAFDAWTEVVGPEGRLPSGMADSATSLEMTLAERFGLTLEEAAQASSEALRAATEPEFTERVRKTLSSIGDENGR